MTNGTCFENVAESLLGQMVAVITRYRIFELRPLFFSKRDMRHLFEFNFLTQGDTINYFSDFRAEHNNILLSDVN